MPWFQKLCRQMGLTIHEIVKPVKASSDKQTISHTVEEEKLNEKVTLRRTTIEEVEIKRDDQDTNADDKPRD